MCKKSSGQILEQIKRGRVGRGTDIERPLSLGWVGLGSESEAKKVKLLMNVMRSEAEMIK